MSDWGGLNKAFVRVIVHRATDDCLSFDLIFEDGSYKPYKLDAYEIKALRGLDARAIIEQMAITYYESLGQNIHIINLTFL